jgi:voltage-gated potassium channel
MTEPRVEDERVVLAMLAGLAATAGASAGGMSTYEAWKRELRSAVTQDPFDVTMVTVFGGAFLFYVAEKDHNPKVRSYFDALVFISTCLSVGYADVFARTPAGKAIAAAVMTVGPALSGAIFEEAKAPTGPAGDGAESAPRVPPEAIELQRVMVEKLDAILGELRAKHAEGERPAG